MTKNIVIYLAIMFVVTYAVRVIPMTLIRKPITNKFFKSFLYYVPYVTLAVMTFPAIMEVTTNPITGILALVCGVIVAFFTKNMFFTAGTCTIVALICEFIISKM